MITKEMLKRCLNHEMRAFCALDEDVKKAFIDKGEFTEILLPDRTWRKCFGSPEHKNMVYRLSPDTPTEPEYEEKEIREIGFFYCMPNGLGVNNCVVMKNFIGIIYTLNGVETLRTSVDAAFGTPVRVRFAKDGK